MSVAEKLNDINDNEAFKIFSASLIVYGHNEFKNAIKLFYMNYINDNREILYYLENIEQNSGNSFDNIIMQYLSFGFNKQDAMLNISEEAFNSFENILKTIVETAAILFQLANDTNNFKDLYKMTEKLKIVSNTEDSTKLTNKYKMKTSFSGNSKFIFTENTLYIVNPDLIEIDFSKYNYVYNYDTDASDTVVLKNYLFMMMSFKDYNMKSQISAFYFIMVIITQFVDFINILFKFMEANTKRYICLNYENVYNFITNFANLKYEIDDISSTLGIETTAVQINVTCTNLCPIKFDIIDSDIFLNYDTSIEKEYIIYINQKSYEIKSARFEYTDSKKSKRLTSLTINAASKTDDSCRKNLTMPFVDIKISDNIKIMLKSKNMMDVKRDYKAVGGELEKMNSSIADSKKKINKLVKVNEVQTSIVKEIDLRLNVYYVATIIIILTFIWLRVINTDRHSKFYVGGFILLVIICMNIANHFLNVEYVESFESFETFESFENDEGIMYCESLIGSNLTDIEKINIRYLTSYIFISIINGLLTKYSVYLSTLESKDFFQALTQSMKAERTAFNEYESVYKFKSESNKRSIDIMKHEMIDKNGFTVFLSVCLLIFAIFFMLHTYVDNEEYNKYFFVVCVILISLTLYKFYYTILHPVQTRAKHKYWYDTSNKTKIKAS